METSEKTGFFLVVIAALLYLGTNSVHLEEGLRIFLLLLGAMLAIWGAVLLVDWLIALGLNRFQQFRLAEGQPHLSILSMISRMTPDQLDFVDKLGVVREARADYAGSIRRVYVSPWGKEIPIDWVENYLNEIQTTYPKLRPIGANPDGSIERNRNEELTNWLILWRLAVRPTATSTAELVVPIEVLRERLGVV